MERVSDLFRTLGCRFSFNARLAGIAQVDPAFGIDGIATVAAGLPSAGQLDHVR
jgi:hypothetical protein